MRKLTCHCGGVQAEVNVPEKGFEKFIDDVFVPVCSDKKTKFPSEASNAPLFKIVVPLEIKGILNLL